jgi:pimeloyl-ACP methyl ester carboxylesterase
MGVKVLFVLLETLSERTATSDFKKIGERCWLATWSASYIHSVRRKLTDLTETERRPRRLHALLVDEHGDFCGSLLLGTSHQPLQRRQRLHPGCRERVSWRELSSPAELDRAAYHKLIYYNEVDKGGHYPAWEEPQLFSEEVRAGFRPLR